jgi:hypothetical protein
MPTQSLPRTRSGAGIQVGVGGNLESLDSRFRGKDGKEKVDFESTATNSLGIEARVI